MAKYLINQYGQRKNRKIANFEIYKIFSKNKFNFSNSMLKSVPNF